MKVSPTSLPGVMLVEPRVFPDARGFFMETYNRARYQSAGLPADFAQDNLSLSAKGVLRGLHFQNPNPQGKLVQVLEGEVFDVAVDIRVGSPSFGRWVGVRLSGEDRRQLWVPEGFAHGFLVISETALFSYKCTALYDPQAEGAVLWSDRALAIEWPLEGTREPSLSAKDAAAPRLDQIEPGRLPRYQGP